MLFMASQLQERLQGMLRPLPPAKALEVLKRKWERHFDKQVSIPFQLNSLTAIMSTKVQPGSHLNVLQPLHVDCTLLLLLQTPNNQHLGKKACITDVCVKCRQ